MAVAEVKRVKFSELCGFWPKQWTATHTADAHKYTLFGGSRGPGKSHWLRWLALRWLLKWAGEGHTGVNVMLGCEDYPSLKDRQIGKIEVEFPSYLGELKDTKSKGLGFHLYPHYGGGSILLRNLDDPSKYQSAEFAAILIDELTRNPVRTFDILRGSLRWPGIPDVRFAAASNPAANWVRDYWIEKALPENLQSEGNEFAFVPALPADNPALDPSYWQMLNTLSGPLREAWLDGNWYAAVEGLVYPTFDQGNVTDREPDMERPFEIGIDDGYVDPRATLFIQRQENGDILVFDELYETRTLEEQTIAHILTKCLSFVDKNEPTNWDDMDVEQKMRWCRADGVPLPELAAVSHEAVALRQRLRMADIPARNWMANKAGGNQSTRLAAINHLRSLICDGQQYRALQIHQRCRHLLDEIRSGYVYPEGKHDVETKPADGNDHAVEALQGWCYLRVRAI